MWFQSGENEVCQESDDPCADSGIFEPDESSTFDVISNDFSIQYGDHSYAKGVFASETFSIGGVTVSNLTVGVATDANATDGIMGIGYSSNEAIVSLKGSKAQYKNLPDLLKDEGLIATRAYSLWLNDEWSSTGTVLFGGIDRAKYDGDLVVMPIDKYSGETEPSEFFITLDGIGFTDTDGSETTVDQSLEEAVLLDSGTSFSYLSYTLQSSLAKIVGAQYNSRLEYYVQTCDVLNVDASIDFYFDDLTIKVPVRNLFVVATDEDDQPITFTTGEQVCLFTVLDNSDVGVSILGDSFLRAAYVVYDLDNNEIGMAQTKYNVTDSDIVAITDSIPARATGSAVALSSTVSADLGGVDGGTAGTVSASVVSASATGFSITVSRTSTAAAETGGATSGSTSSSASSAATSKSSATESQVVLGVSGRRYMGVIVMLSTVVVGGVLLL